jgi:hypothetical protein
VTGALAAEIGRRETEHLRFGPVPRAEIAALEARIGHRLPAALASALETVGNGIFFGKEELFGPRRMMVHDIELLPDMMTIKAGIAGLPADWLPFHRRDDVVHVVDLSEGAFGQVRSWPDGAAHGDVGDFLARCLTPTEA